MKRTPLRRGGPLKRKKPMNKVNPKRRQKERTRAYGSPRRREWVSQQPCWICKQTPSENAHVKKVGDPASGMGRKDDADHIVPLCRKHHQELHQLGQQRFDKQYGTDLDFAAILTEDRWRAGEGAESPDKASQ